MIRDIVLLVWFAVAAVAFFGPWLGLKAPVSALGAVYATLLVGGIAWFFYDARRHKRGETDEA